MTTVTTSHHLLTNVAESNTSWMPNYTEPEIPTPYWSLPGRVLLGVSMMIFMVLAIVGNLMVLAVYKKHPELRKRTLKFLCSLAVADLCTGLTLMPFSLTTAITGEWVFGDIFCQLNGFLMPLLLVASIHTLMYISIFTYISLSRGNDAIDDHYVIAMIIAPWLWGVLTAYLTVHGLTTVEYKPYTTQCGPTYPHDLRTYALPVWILITCYLIPFIVMLVSYIRIYAIIRQGWSFRKKNANDQKRAISQQERKVTFTLLIVVIIFVLSWLPYAIYAIYVSVLKNKQDAPEYGNPLSYWFGYMNSACNPIIYAFRSPNFRAGYRSILCGEEAILISESDGAQNREPTVKLRNVIKRSVRTSARRIFGIGDSSRKDPVTRARSMPSGTTVTFEGGNRVLRKNGKVISCTLATLGSLKVRSNAQLDTPAPTSADCPSAATKAGFVNDGFTNDDDRGETVTTSFTKTKLQRLSRISDISDPESPRPTQGQGQLKVFEQRPEMTSAVIDAAQEVHGDASVTGTHE